MKTLYLLITILIMTVSICYASIQRTILVTNDEMAFGTDSNPIYVQGV